MKRAGAKRKWSRTALAASIALLAPVPRAEGQAATTPRREAPCDGLTISRVDIRQSERTIVDGDRTPGWARAVLQALLLGTPTRASALEPYLQLEDGGACTERRRAESERLLRTLPYIADATVTVFDEPDGKVRVEVVTTDDKRPIIGLGLSGNRPNDVELGNSNIGGYGHLAAVSWHDGGAFRDGFGIRYADYHIFGGPNIAAAQLARTPLGDFVNVSLGRPFFTEYQHAAGYIGYVRDDSYFSFVRPEGDPFSIKTGRERSDAGLAFRLNTFGNTSWLIGALGSFERRTSGNRPVILSDSGLRDTTDAVLRSRFHTQQSTRAGLVLGFRALSFTTTRAFDGLEGVQDIARGVQIATSVGKGIGGDDTRAFVTTDLYTGVGTDAGYLGLRLQAEARRNPEGWGNTVASGRIAWYSHSGERQTSLVSVEYAGSSSDSIPYQLTMADVRSGIRGYTGSRLAGGRRVVARLERRINLPGIGRYFGWGVAGFGDVGQLWAAKVPYGAPGTRASLGLSLLAAVPRASRSVARVDIGYPLVRDRNAKGFDIRVSYRMTDRAFWRDPTQIARARLGAPTTDIFTWP